MKDRLLYVTIGVLLGVVVMQWAMPTGQATVTTAPVGNIIGMSAGGVLLSNGEMWKLDLSSGWVKRGDLPIPASQVQFIVAFAPLTNFVDKSGNFWQGDFLAICALGIV